MSTKMTEPDWGLALEVFRACLPRRGAKALYRGQARIEQAVGKLKRFKRIALSV